MDRQCVYSEILIESAQTIDVVDHCQQQRRRQCRMSGEPMEIVADRDTGWSSGVEASEAAAGSGDGVVCGY